MWGRVCVAFGLTWLSAAAAVPPDFMRYEVILDRRPFGAAAVVEAPPPDVVVPDVPPPEFLANLRMCAITDRGGRVRVGFVDSSVRPPRTYFLFVGDEENGFSLVQADYETESAVVRKDGHEVAISMGGAASLAAAAARAAAGAPRASSAPRSVVQARSMPSRSRLTRDQYEAEQDEGVRGVPVPPRRGLPQQTGVPAMDELPPELRDYAMRQYNLELIRAQGEKGVPLPITLTEAEDAMLVEEGVLDP